MQMPPLALYIHLPYCLQKCPYCDFNSHGVERVPDEAGYIAALLRDLGLDLPLVAGRPIRSIFIGGGTPSLFSGEAVNDLLDGVRARLPLAPDAEITLEANPGASDAARFRAYRAAGVNRLSIGIQSFDDAKLRALGRVHDRAEALAAVAAARSAGFNNLNLDLMYGLPGQTPAEAAADLRTAIDLAPEHLSWYQLTLEPNTAFHHAPPPVPDDDLLVEMEEIGHPQLAAAGYGRYEVSAYARPGRQCRHNLNYWGFGDYLGIGAGAHGKLTHDGIIERRWRHRRPEVWQAAAGTPEALAGTAPVGAAEVAFEFLMNALRLLEGFEVARFEARTGLPWTRIAPTMARAADLGLIQIEAGHVRPTAQGMRYLNDLLGLFLPEGEA